MLASNFDDASGGVTKRPFGEGLSDPCRHSSAHQKLKPSGNKEFHLETIQENEAALRGCFFVGLDAKKKNTINPSAFEMIISEPSQLDNTRFRA